MNLNFKKTLLDKIKIQKSNSYLILSDIIVAFVYITYDENEI